MFLPRVVSRLNLLSKVSGSLQNQSQALCSAVQHCHSTRFRAFHYTNRCLISADNKLPPKLWTPLEPELEEVLVPRKLSVSPLESWLSLRYSLPPLLEASLPLEEVEIVGKSMVLPPCAVPLLEDGESSTPLNCKNVLEIRRRKMNRHKYKKLLKRTKFLRRRVRDSRRKKKQAKFERDLARIVRGAGLKKSPVCSALILPCAWAQNSLIVEARNLTVSPGSDVVLPCHNQRMVWRQDRLRDRQRVVHWDLIQNQPVYTVERILDMFSGGTERLYNDYNRGRITISKDAFSDGNFSLVINNVDVNDKGVYTCNLHHHYCKVHQSIKIQLNVTKSPRKEKRVWDGDKNVFVVLVGKSVVLPCVNRRQLWMESQGDEGQQQVVNWDWQAPGVTRDRADRLIDMYASGENRQYGPLFLQNKMNISTDAFSIGDFSLSVRNIQPSDKGLYSCQLHHHYCGLHERRIFRVIVSPSVQPLPPAHSSTETPKSTHSVLSADDPNTNMVEAPHVLNVILPENQTHYLHQVGYILAIFVLLLLILIGIIMTTRHCKNKELEFVARRSDRGRRTSIELDATELQPYNQDDLRLDYKNNIMKGRAEANNYPSPNVIDFNREMERMSWK